MARAQEAAPARRRLTRGQMAVTIATVLVLAALLAFPVIGSQVYFRHDDATLLQWAATYRGTPAQVFSTDPAVNGWGAYRGMDTYYRPTVYLIVLELVRAFGLNASVLMTLAGMAMALVLATYMWVVRRRDAWVAVVSMAALGLLYGGVLYQAFRLAVAYPYLFEMLAIALALGAIRRKKRDWARWALVAGAVLAYVMSSARQSALVIVPVVLVLWWLFVERGEGERLAAWRRWVVGVSTTAVAAVLVVVTALPEGVAGLLSQRAETFVRHLFETFWFYWHVATGGPRLAILLVGLGYVAARWILEEARGAGPDRAAGVGAHRPSRATLWRVAGVVLACAIGIAISVASPWAVLVVSVLAARRRPELVAGMGWFWVGLAVFLVPDYYHQAYLLEALLGLSFAIGLCWLDVLADGAKAVWRAWGRIGRGWGASTVAGVVIAIGIVGVLALPSVLSAAEGAVGAVVTFIDVNKSAEAMITHVARELPEGATVLVLSEAQLGRSNETWRSESLEFRASQVRVMDVEDVGAMVAALGGRARVRDFATPDEVKGSPVFGIVYSNDETREFEKAWSTRPVADFSRGNSFCRLLALTPK